ncbi:retroviral-like aspartic protease family protein [Candidatus Roizmanbacteria bacterium]|nr:retroviral-like aspartic protease family protein [Candidatus Roizmanbacteria bacterium]
MKLAKSPFSFIGRTRLGKIYRPYVVVSFFSKLLDRWLPIEMVIDTGADYTLLPKRYSTLLGINLDAECFKQKTLGVGGEEIVYQYKTLSMKLYSWEREIPVGFLNRDDVPALLGRLECLERLKLTLANLSTLLAN